MLVPDPRTPAAPCPLLHALQLLGTSAQNDEQQQPGFLLTFEFGGVAIHHYLSRLRARRVILLGPLLVATLLV